MKKIVFEIILSVFLLSILNIHIDAHNSLLDIEYDPCVDYIQGDGDDEIWYYLCEKNYSHGEKLNYYHLSDEIQTIKYYFSDYGRIDSSYTWTSDVSIEVANEIRSAYIDSIKKWNEVYYYSYDTNDNLISNKIINIVEGTVDDHNLTIYPFYESNSFVAMTVPDDNGIIIDTNDINYTHTHYANWYMNVNVYYMYEHAQNSYDSSVYNRETAGAHEMGHILGLDDIDICCPNVGDHHGEVIMGYQYLGYHSLDITYKDIAGVSITRGFHTDTDHQWMKRNNYDETIDMICSICNGVKYNVNLDPGGITYQGKTFVDYQESVNHNENHLNMLLVATNGNDDYYKCQNCRHIECRKIEKEIDLNCFMKLKTSTRFCNINTQNESLFYKMKVDCSGTYLVSSTASYPISMTLLDFDMNEILSIVPIMTNNNCTGTINTNLNVGTYYLRINYVNSNNCGSISTSFETTNPNVGIPISINTNTNMKTHLHKQASGNYLSRASFTNTSGPGYYKFRLNAGSNVTYPVGAVRIYSDSNRQNLLSRYSVSGIYSNAFSNYNENEMYVYLPENGTYYIDIVMPNNNYNNLTLYIERSDITNFDYTNTLAFQSFTPLFENQTTQNYFEEITISHRSKFSLEIFTNSLVTNSIPVYIFQKVLEPGNEPGVYNYYPVRVSNPNWYITSYTYNPIFNIILEAGTYYIGYDLNIYNVSINFCLRRVVDYEASSLATLITDPALNQGYTLGSEVNFNGGAPLDTTITEGFTRCIYLMFNNYIALPDSRLDYDWYSSNDSVASVTHYGTVLARPVNSNTNVMIYAVLKEVPSVVLSIQLTVLDDIETDEIEIVSNLSYSYSLENGTYQLALDNTNSPYPWISYYIWAIDISNDYPDLEVEMNQWGYITSNETGVAILTANYYLNPRVYLTIYLTINP